MRGPVCICHSSGRLLLVLRRGPGRIGERQHKQVHHQVPRLPGRPLRRQQLVQLLCPGEEPRKHCGCRSGYDVCSQPSKFCFARNGARSACIMTAFLLLHSSLSKILPLLARRGP